MCEESFRAGHLPAGGPALPTPRKPTPPTTAAIDAFCAQFDALCCRAQERVAFRHYLIGLLLPREHNQTIVEVAAIVPSANRQALHHFLHDAPWDAAALNRRRLERWHAHSYLHPHAGGVLIVDETGDPKRGHRSVLVEATGGPLAVVIAGANVHDTKLLAATLEALVVERPTPTPVHPQHLCLDTAYDNPTGYTTVEASGYVPHMRRIGEEKLDPTTGEPRFPARRWVVERTLAWLSKCRALLIRYDKKARNFLALLQLACALLWFRRLHRLTVVR